MSDEATDADEETYSAIRTVLGSTHRTARWHLTDEVDVLTALGRSSFDLRLAETTGRPVAEISVTCILGSVSLVVPPGTLVVLDGTSFLARAASNVEPGDVSSLPRIEVTATTILGRVKIVSRELIPSEREVTAVDEEPAPIAIEQEPIDSASDVDEAFADAPVDTSPATQEPVDSSLDNPDASDADDDATPLAS